VVAAVLLTRSGDAGGVDLQAAGEHVVDRVEGAGAVLLGGAVGLLLDEVAHGDDPLRWLPSVPFHPLLMTSENLTPSILRCAEYLYPSPTRRGFPEPPSRAGKGVGG